MTKDMKRQLLKAAENFYLGMYLCSRYISYIDLPILFFAGASVKQNGKNLTLKWVRCRINNPQNIAEKGFFTKVTKIEISKYSNDLHFTIAPTDIEISYQKAITHFKIGEDLNVVVYCAEILDRRAIENVDYSGLSNYRNDYTKDKTGLLDKLPLKIGAYYPAKEFFSDNDIDAFIAANKDAINRAIEMKKIEIERKTLFFWDLNESERTKQFSDSGIGIADFLFSLTKW
jgi:hypothetical protein